MIHNKNYYNILNLSLPRPTYRFYSVKCQKILLVQGRPLGSEGVKKTISLNPSPPETHL